MSNRHIFSAEVLRLDPEIEVSRICSRIRELLQTQLRRRGAVIGLSGGIDSTVTAALAVRALGPGRILGLEMPERHSEEETLRFSGMAVAHLAIDSLREDISGTLESLGCYRRYDAAVGRLFPSTEKDGNRNWYIDVMDDRGFTMFSIVAKGPGSTFKRAPLTSYLELVAATNFKQRTRKMLEYYHADRLNYCVAGTPNRLEYDQGFFVKLGDGAADIKPIAHLYKSQVYQLAEYLGIPEEIRRRKTDDRYLFSCPGTGRVLFFTSLRTDGSPAFSARTMQCRREQWHRP